MKTVCERNKCVGCKACIDACSKNAITFNDTMDAYNAVIDENRCISCGACSRVCQVQHEAPLYNPLFWKQGYARDECCRKAASSGGVASAIERAFVEAGGTAVSCVFKNGEFIFDSADSAVDCAKFVGSKYVKSDMKSIYQTVRMLLTRDCKVLFVGLPCQVAALKMSIPTKISHSLYCVDLICHGTPSPRLLEAFLLKHGTSLSEFHIVAFRRDNRFQIEKENKPLLYNGVCDRYMVAFLNGLTYTENCYSCKYAKLARVSDLTLGDSWGSDLPKEEQRKGISLVLCQTSKGRELLELADLQLFDVDLENAINNNHQLKEPSERPAKRNFFFEKLKNGRNFDYLVTKIYPRHSIKQDIKYILLKLKIVSLRR